MTAATTISTKITANMPWHVAAAVTAVTGKHGGGSDDGGGAGEYKGDDNDDVAARSGHSDGRGELTSTGKYDDGSNGDDGGCANEHDGDGGKDAATRIGRGVKVHFEELRFAWFERAAALQPSSKC
jgi:hypothetical protein